MKPQFPITNVLLFLLIPSFVFPQLAGNYTINSNQPASTTNYQSFKAFTDDLELQGINSALTVNVANGSGPYFEQVEFSKIQGLSSSNTITLNGNGEYLISSGTSSNYGILVLDSVSYITIDSLNISQLGSYNTMGIMIINHANNNTIKNCLIDLSVSLSQSSLNYIGILLGTSRTSPNASGETGNNNQIVNNRIIGGYAGISLGGNSSTKQTNNQIIDNRIEDFHLRGIAIAYQQNCFIARNEISRPNRTSVNGNFNGIYAYESNTIEVVNNKIHDTHTAAQNSSVSSVYGIYFSNCDGLSTTKNKVVNNLLYNFNNNEGFTGALHNSSSDNTQYFHNTIVLTNKNATSGSCRGITQALTASGVEIKNNIFFIDQGGSGIKHAIHLNNYSSNYSCDYNNIFLGNSGSGSYFTGHFAFSYASINNWRAANGGAFGANSNNQNPLFINPLNDNYMPYGTAAENTGENLGIITDLIGTPRSTSTPDMGAYEFSSPSGELSFLSLVGLNQESNCYSANEQIGFSITNTIGNANFINDSLTIVYEIVGKSTLIDSLIIKQGNLNSGDTNIFWIPRTLDLSQSTSFQLNAYLQFKPDFILSNDTLKSINLGGGNLTAYSDTNAYSLGLQYEVTAKHPLLNSQIKFSEIWQYSSAYSNSIASPSYFTILPNRDYIELSNFSSFNLDISNYQVERLGTSPLLYTFPQGTIIKKNSTIILVSGSGTDDITNGVYYIGGSTDPVFSSSLVGYILSSANSKVLDAVALNNYSFNSSSGISTNDWNHPIPSSSSNMGAYLDSADNNSGLVWKVTSTGYQNTQSLGVVNGLPNHSVFRINWSGAAINDSTLTINQSQNNKGTFTYYLSFTIDSCIFLDTLNIGIYNVCDSLGIQTNVIQNASCFGSADGEATVSPIQGQNPFTYLWSNNHSGPTNNTLSAGKHYVTLTDANNCQQIDSVTITQPNPINSVISDTACGSYYWSANNQTYTTSGNFSTVLNSSSGCDSTITLNLMILPVSTSIVLDTSCRSYLWLENNITYTSTGIYYDTLQNSLGCDSIISLDLKIDQNDTSTTLVGDSIYANNVSATSYQWLTCQSNGLFSTVIGENNRGFKPNTSGNFALAISQGKCLDTTACKRIIIVGTSELNIKSTNFNLFPNPGSGSFYVQVEPHLLGSSIEIFDTSGKSVFKSFTKSNKTFYNLDLPNGLYLIKIDNHYQKLIIEK